MGVRRAQITLSAELIETLMISKKQMKERLVRRVWGSSLSEILTVRQASLKKSGVDPSERALRAREELRRKGLCAADGSEGSSGVVTGGAAAPPPAPTSPTAPAAGTSGDVATLEELHRVLVEIRDKSEKNLRIQEVCAWPSETREGMMRVRDAT
jgi:hypothetical protein